MLTNEEWLALARQNADALEVRSLNESETRRLLVDPLLAHAGYDLWRRNAAHRVETEFSIPGSASAAAGRADYVLYREGKKYIAVEAKALDLSLDDEAGRKKTKQAINYALWCKPRLRWACVTDGRRWRLYDANREGAPESRLVHEWHLGETGPTFCRLLGPDAADRLEDLVKHIQAVTNPAFKVPIINHTLSELCADAPAPQPVPSPHVNAASTPSAKVPSGLTGSKIVTATLRGKSVEKAKLYWASLWKLVAMDAASNGKLAAFRPEDVRPTAPTGKTGELNCLKLADSKYLYCNFTSAECAARLAELAPKVLPKNALVIELELSDKTKRIWNLP